MSSKRRSRRMAERQNFKKKLTSRCPNCGKVSASSEEEAWEIARRQFARFGGEEPKRVYPCKDDGKPPFHWTRQEKYTRQEETAPVELSAEHLTEEFWTS